MQRRQFLTQASQAAAVLALPTLVPASVLGKQAPSNRITVALIGTGRQLMGVNLPQLLALPDVQVVAVCDVDSWRMNGAKQAVEAHYAQLTKSGQYKGCLAVSDFRELLQRRDIDAVMVSTPDHWHVPMGVMAARAGKHLCIEKPLSLSVAQGRLLTQVVEKQRIIARVDSEFRSLRPYNQAVEWVRNGAIGTLKKIEIGLPSDPEPVRVVPDMPVPKELNYEAWLGPALVVPYTEARVHKPFDVKGRPGWMRISTYAQGMIANWGAHLFDIAQWANNSEYTGPVEVEGKGKFPRGLWDTMINFTVRYRYANGVEMTAQQQPDYHPFIRFEGTEGWLLLDGYPPKVSASNQALLARQPKAGELNLGGTLGDKADFIEGIKNNRQTLEPIEVGHRTITISQLGLIACQVGEKLNWNPEKEQFTGNNAANALLAAPLLREPWRINEKV
ncbi:hypothetical protein GCM10023189_24660 [Nibrella saemangeumensis]|uniref:Gfo/Idh/MocA family oxidoreductase n=1 Tax=Nibrella saemangeumensis TaxID=1084526 RepID=A0ABP8MXX8_9BACT